MLETSKIREISEATNALSWLRLHYEEIVVRLYSCQCKASTMLRDPTKSTGDAWEVVRSGLAKARLSTGRLDDQHELWQRAEDLVHIIANDDSQSRANLDPGSPPSLGDRSGSASMFKPLDILLVFLSKYFIRKSRADKSPCLPMHTWHAVKSRRSLSFFGSGSRVGLSDNPESGRPSRVRRGQWRRSERG